MVRCNEARMDNFHGELHFCGNSTELFEKIDDWACLRMNVGAKVLMRMRMLSRLLHAFSLGSFSVIRETKALKFAFLKCHVKTLTFSQQSRKI